MTGKLTVTDEVTDNVSKRTSEETTSEQVQAPISEGKPRAVYGYEDGVTINLGNYQSRRVTVRLDMPIAIDKFNKASVEWVERFVEKRLQAACDRTDEVVKGKLR